MMKKVHLFSFAIISWMIAFRAMGGAAQSRLATLQFMPCKMALLCCVFIIIGCAQMDVRQMIEKYMWQKRLVFIFSPQQNHPEFLEMRKEYFHAADRLKERDVVVWQLVAQTSVDIDNERKPQLPAKPFYKHFNVEENAFTVIVIGKDGDEKYRGNKKLGIAELEKMIDAMPMRKREKKQK